MVHIRLVVTWMFKILMWGVIASIAWVTFSCEEFCEESTRTAVVVNFYSSANDASLNVNVEIRGVENDSLLYRQASRSQVLLPVNPASNVMSFTIKNDTLSVDTVIFHYTKHYGFISSECGCAIFAEIQGEPERTENTITNVVVTNQKVTTVSYRQGIINDENIRIYY